jgi:hypothetical protein
VFYKLISLKIKLNTNKNYTGMKINEEKLSNLKFKRVNKKIENLKWTKNTVKKMIF